MRPESKCKGCGKGIVWGKLPGGGNVPLDMTPPVYAYNEETGEATRMVATQVYVSHFATCPDANKFSRSNR